MSKDAIEPRDVVIVSADDESWPLAETFVISRGAKSEAHVVVVKVSDGTHTGRGECVPYPRYGESVEGVLAELRAVSGPVTGTRLDAQLKSRAAQNAVDCALWDLEAKRRNQRASQLAGVGPLRSVETFYTLSLDAPGAMAEQAENVFASGLKLLKLKLGGMGDAERMQAVRAACPQARLIGDANEAWSPDDLEQLTQATIAAGFELIEQPLPAGHDRALVALRDRIAGQLVFCADESMHDEADLDRLAERYDAVNIKLDKTGGLSAALRLSQAARACGLRIMVGSMVATSLSMAPAMLVAQDADWVDLDSPLLLAKDRQDGLAVERGRLSPPVSELWG